MKNILQSIVFICLFSFMFQTQAQQVAQGSTDIIKTIETRDARKSTSKRKQAALALLRQLKTATENESVITANALQSIAIMSDALDPSGRGDVSYWLRAATDFSYVSNSIANAIFIIAKDMPDGADKISVLNISRQLSNIDFGSRGNVTYWMHKAESIATETNRNCAQLLNLAKTINGKIPASVFLNAYTEITDSINYSGRGDAKYWIRVANDIVLLAHIGSSSLEFVLNDFSQQVSNILSSYVNRLASMSSEGRGDSDYWSNLVSARGNELSQISISLYKIGWEVG